MINNHIMKRHLHQAVIKPLAEQGFTGKWPHFRRVHPDHIELLSFMSNKYGGSFTVELSAVFPNSARKNYPDSCGLTPDQLTVWHTQNRYRLKGMYDYWFHYCDIYRKYVLFLGYHYHEAREKEADSFIPPKGYKLVQKFNEETAKTICDCVNRQLKDGFLWLKRFIAKNL